MCIVCICYKIRYWWNGYLVSTWWSLHSSRPNISLCYQSALPMAQNRSRLATFSHHTRCFSPPPRPTWHSPSRVRIMQISGPKLGWNWDPKKRKRAASPISAWNSYHEMLANVNRQGLCCLKDYLLYQIDPSVSYASYILKALFYQCRLL